MKSLDIRYLSQLHFTADQAASLKRIGESKGRQALFSRQTPEVLKTLCRAAIIESSESSNRLEGIVAPHARIEAIVQKSTNPRNRPEQEIAGYRDALNLVHESAQNMPFTENVILQLHAYLYRYLPENGGKWKLTENSIVEKNPDGTVRRVRFEPVKAAATPTAMAALVRNYKEALDVHHQEPLVVVPAAILDFLCVHPFHDGNGRTARLLTLLLLYHFDYQVGRYISLERLFEESKESYYETLEYSSQGWHEGKHDIKPWMTYFWGVLIKAYREFEERVDNIRAGRGSKTDQIRQAVARRIGPFAISDIENDCPGISRDMVRVVLRQLKEEGAISPQGKGRGAKWVKRG
ncbi:MAG: cell filamentation protein Fic [Elusimicrobia bacterium HGW-Elusimicrobia-3]|jgi:Fic family protein|nr:MAG: cell filamentation protein Fic [Elusimicrobia bacterium HGW-Elusimicrobia-3]